MSEIPLKLQQEWCQAVLTPVAGSAPCGGNPEYDSQFILLLSQLEPKMGAEYGSFVEAAEPINWVEVEKECRRLLLQAKEIRLIIIFMRCMVRQRGTAALAEGLALLLEALRLWPEAIHPQLADEGEFDPIMRANALAELDAHEGLLADLRQIALSGAQGISPTVRDIEKACQIPREESALPAHTLEKLFMAWESNSSEEIAALHQASRSLTELESLMADTLGDAAPDLHKLKSLLACFKPRAPAPESRFVSQPQAECASQPQAEEPQQNAAALATPITPSSAEPLQEGGHRVIRTRHDALGVIQELQAWFIHAEPSSPAAGLLLLTEQIVGKNFSDIFQLLPQELITHLTTRQEQ